MAKQNIKNNRKTKIVAATAALLLVGGAAFAYWTTQSQGSGSATNAPSNGTLVLKAHFAGGLAPGATRTVTYTATNSGGSSSLQVGTISHIVTTDKVGCTAADFTIGPVFSNTTVLADVIDAELSGTGTLRFVDSTENQDACKGATVTLALSAN
jgi:hypothetical protein